MLPICFGGAEVEEENLDSRAARVAKLRRHPSAEETESSILALMTLPCGSTVMMTVTMPAPMQR